LLAPAQPVADGHLQENPVDEATSNAVKNKLLSAFAEGTFARVDVLGYGDDPAVEPGETAVRVFIDRAGRPEENWDSKETLDDWFKANSKGLGRLHDGLLPAIAWIEFFPDTPERQAMPSRPDWGHVRSFLGNRLNVLEAMPGFTRVATLLGPADLATVDALITAGVATSRAEVLRWVVGRIGENPAYAQLQERAREIDELKAQF
jgi:hypothetical protein